MLEIPKPPYKSTQGQWLKKPLFADILVDVPSSTRPPFKPIFTLNHERPGLICVRKTFVEERDPTGYRWAMKYLGDMEHWDALMRCKWFAEAHEGWMVELKLVMKAEALDKIREIAAGESSQALAAAKYLANEEYDRPARGRPSKAEITGELKRAAQALSAEDEDLARIGGLTVIKGGKHGA